MNLPSKKVIPFAVACFAAAGAIGFAASYTPKPKIDPAAPVLAVVPQPMTDSSISSSTELKKWRETLGVIAPNNGTSASSTPAKLSATDRLSRELVAAVMSAQKSGSGITPEMEEKIAQNLLLSSEYNGNFGVGNAKLYTSDDITVTSDVSAAALRSYGNAIGTILERDGSLSLDMNELVILEQALSTRDEKEIAKLDIIIESYRKILKGMLAVPVPQAIAGQHLSLINNFSRAITVDTEMRKIFIDPLAAVNALKDYQDVAVAISTTFKTLSDYFSAKGVWYGAGEPGYTFVHV